MLVLFAFAGVSVATVAVFLVVDLFNFALIDFLLRVVPYEPFEILPFFVFLSPLPMNNVI